jgi:RNA polymerase sigma factor (sigma-70 family)
MKIGDERHKRLISAVTRWDSSRFAYTDPRNGRYIPHGVPDVAGNKPGADGVLTGEVPRSFEEVVLPHLDAAFNYARWLTKNDADAEDVVQDAYVRALRFFSSLRGEDARAWLFTIVRNTWYGRFPRRAGSGVMTVSDEDADNQADASLDPEAQAIQQQTVDKVRRALETLPTDFREVLVLRELEGLSYKEIAAIVGIPLGTVMSRLARARDRLAGVLCPSDLSGGHRGLP